MLTVEETGEHQRAIFIGGSSEATGLAAKIASAIAAAGMSSVARNMGAFPAGQTFIERIESFPHEFDGTVRRPLEMNRAAIHPS